MLSTMQDSPLSLGRLLAYGTTVHGTSEVVTWQGQGSRRASYSELGVRAARLAHALRGLGITGDHRVGTLLWNTQEHVEAYLAVPAMGAVLHTLNLRLHPDQLSYIINHAGDSVILVDATLLPLLAKVASQLTTVRHVVVVGEVDYAPLLWRSFEIHDYGELLAAQPTAFPWPELDERSAAAMCYTSGTTGNPRGVAYSHRSIWLHSMQVCMGDGFRLTQADRVLTIVPQFHAMAWGLPYAAMMVGASLLMPGRYLQPAPLAAFIAAERPTISGAVPTIWNDLLSYLNDHPSTLESLREVIVGGSACPPRLMRELEERHGVRLVHAWGMTETSPLGSVARPPVGVTDDDEVWRYRLSQGRLPASVEARLTGPNGEIVPNDGRSVGELEVRGPWVTASYLGDESPAADSFRDGWLRTGDVGMISPDGFLTLTDRAKDVIKSGGEWISSVALENAVMAHPLVAEAAVVGIPDATWGERPLAVVVLTDPAVAPDELREFLAQKVAKWQLPERWVFVEEVPKTSVGKFDKKVIRARYADGEWDTPAVR
jgi:fatty-acyl-CoA synthase